MSVKVVAVTSEGLECFGGMGYLEDTGLPSMLRDSQVFYSQEPSVSLNFSVMYFYRVMPCYHGICCRPFVCHVAILYKNS